jgi:hypothetical protein
MSTASEATTRFTRAPKLPRISYPTLRDLANYIECTISEDVYSSESLRPRFQPVIGCAQKVYESLVFEQAPCYLFVLPSVQIRELKLKVIIRLRRNDSHRLHLNSNNENSCRE